MKVLATIMAALMIASVASAVPVSYLVSDGDGTGYFVGSLYKDAQTKEVFKEVSTTIEDMGDYILETVFLGLVVEGTLDTLNDGEIAAINTN